MKKLLIITGPTATGKTALGVELAKKFNGEIISADSRQVYIGNDVETGKDRSFPQWGIDIVEPGTDFNVSAFVAFAQKIIADIQGRQKLPIIVGGTGQYIKELLNPSETLRVPMDLQLRAGLEKLSLEQLQKELIKVNRDKWESMNPSDQKNPRRLVRAIEVASQNTGHKEQKTDKFDVLMVGLTAPREQLHEKIIRRRVDRPDLVTKEFALAKKQLIYMEKFLQPIWFDVTAPNCQQEIFSLVTKWYTRDK